MDDQFEEYCQGVLSRSREEDFDPEESEPWQLGWLDTGFQIEELERSLQ